MTDRRTQINRLARIYVARLDDLKDDFIGRDEAIDVVGLAVLCREHVLLIGPPGTAKTALLVSFAELFDTRMFTYLLTRFTEPSELFGPVDVRLFQRESIYRINTSGMLPTAQLAFLDEVFEGSSAILNALLTLINERRFYNGGEPEEAALISLFGSSNTMPDDPVLAAFSDRFLLRCRLDYVSDEDVEDVLDVGWRAEKARMRSPAADGVPQPGVAGLDRTSVRFSLDDLAVLQHAVSTIDLSPIRSSYAEIMRELRAQGITFSDRRAVKAQKVIAASALLGGRTAAETADLAALAYVWTDPRDEAALHRVLVDHDVALTERRSRVRDIAEIRLDIAQLRARRENLISADERRELLRQLQRLDIELRRDHPGSSAELDAVKSVQREAIRELSEQVTGEKGGVNV